MIKYLHSQNKVIIILFVEILTILVTAIAISDYAIKTDYMEIFLGSYFNYLFFLIFIPLILLLQSTISKMFKNNFSFIRTGYILNNLLNVFLSVIITIEALVILFVLTTLITLVNHCYINIILLKHYLIKMLIFSLTYTSIGQFLRLITKNTDSSLLAVALLSILTTTYNAFSIDIKYGSFLNNPLVLNTTIFLMMISIIGIALSLYAGKDKKNEQQTWIY